MIQKIKPAEDVREVNKKAFELQGLIDLSYNELFMQNFSDFPYV